jgi:hypothetical protein
MKKRRYGPFRVFLRRRRKGMPGPVWMVSPAGVRALIAPWVADRFQKIGWMVR